RHAVSAINPDHGQPGVDGVGVEGADWGFLVTGKAVAGRRIVDCLRIRAGVAEVRRVGAVPGDAQHLRLSDGHPRWGEALMRQGYGFDDSVNGPLDHARV